MKLFSVALLSAILLSSGAFAQKKTETQKNMDKAKSEVIEAGKDAKRASKKAYRKVKDETCEMINGKMECLGQKAKHSIQNVGDKIEDAVE